MRKLVGAVLGASLMLGGAAATAPVAQAAPVRPITGAAYGCNYSHNHTQILRYGSKGAAVKQAQCLLNANNRIMGLGLPNLAVDGDYGDRTYQMVIRFQKAMEIKADGIVGPQTWYWLEKTN
ncbi:peptidoglycan-binding domain-containing protein [Arsenicicoccus dermatophilus]|uniref:peptidoglycan-binding domain-containing protein n=1 Tax=Arsenicicoccus dermatophilus TaxID=1076331 RepID=UPI001F4C672B|nr:peptidoglycan-binding domain-containing protein [Arsenicicoccus dermatophilus]MCH8611559.1 peptidoglycan-binding protein [Arsenicicoccus dermatophilus]